MPHRSTPFRSPWPYAIAAYFAVFITAIALFVSWAVRQRMDLVGKDYYEQEIRFQEQIDRVHRTRAVRGQVKIACDTARRRIDIKLPEAHARQPTSGRIHFYRPSDARLDRDVPLHADLDGNQRFDTSQFQSGLWKVCLRWRANGEEFYFDQPIVIQSSNTTR